MTRQTARDGDLDFEQMLGELAAMKTDLANRQANRVASRPTRSRTVTADGEPRRVRARRAATDHADVPLSVEAPSTASAISNQTILSPTSPVASRSATLLASLHDSDHDKEQGREPSPSATQGQEQRPKKSDQGQQPEMRIETTLPDTPLHSSEAATKSVQSVQSIEPDDLLGSSSLARSESRRNPAAPLPPKSAQRSRSISNNSGRTSRTFHNEGEINRENDIMPNSQEISPQETSTAIFGSNTPARPSPRTFASAPAITAGNGQQAASSPRLPARSNSRNYVRPSASGTSSTSDQTPQGSRSASRRNTFSKSEGGQEGSLYIGTPSIAEDRELTFVSQSTQDQQQRQQLASTLSEEAPQRIPTKKPSNSTLRRPNEDEGSPNPSIAPSLSPSSTIPSPVFGQHDATLKHEEHERQGRPALRKQQSADPAAMHRQYQQDPPTVRDNLPSRQASERRPDRARNYSNSGNTDDEQLPERGRAQNQDGGSSKGGMFSWVRSRSKSRDATSTRQNQDTPAYPDYNPSLIPSRSASSSGSRTKSLPRKPSNQNLHATNDGWPPYSPGTLNSHPTTPGGSVLNRSLSKSNLIPSKFGTPLSTPNETSQPPPLLNVSTNMNTIHHEKMVRGMGMGSTPIAPTVLLTPQPSFPPTGSNGGAPGGGKRNMALAMMKQDGSPSSSELQMQQRHQQLQQAQMQHIQQQQQRLATTSATNSTSPPATPTSPRNQSTPQGSLAPSTPSSSTSAAATTTPATQRLVATRIYIQTETDFKSVNLAPNSTALDVLHMLQQRGTFGDIGDSRYHDRWTVFEYSKEFMIERPLRDFEVLLDVMKTWEADKDNKMICKSFPARNELSAKEVIRLVGPAGQEDFVRPHGWVHVEMKKGKWVKRYLHTTDTAVYHSKDNKFTGESMLCLLRNFDVYAVQVPRKKAPTKFGFALKSSDSIHMFETPEDDYIHYVCTESGESLRDWLVGLRAIKGIFMYHANPEMIRQGQKRAEELMSSGSQDGLARGKLTDEQATIITTHFYSPHGVSADTLLPSNTATISSALHISPLNSSVAHDRHDREFLVPGLSTTVTSTTKEDSPTTPSSLLASPPISSRSNPDLASIERHTDKGRFANISNTSRIENMPTTSNSSNGTSGSGSGGTTAKNPFMAGSLLQQRVEVEKQEIEDMKLQLKMREQAGVLGARNMSMNLNLNDSTTNGSFPYQTGGHGRDLSSAGSANSLSSIALSRSLQHQQAPQSSQPAPPKFGGPGTLIEKGEARAAELLQRSKSAGPGLLRPAHVNGSSGAGGGYRRTRSKGRIPTEDQVRYGGPESPRSPDSSPSVPSVPQGPLLQFDDPDAMIQPGLLLSRAKSAKQPFLSNPVNSTHNGYLSRTKNSDNGGRSRGRHGGHGACSQEASQSRTKIKPLVDLGSIKTNQDVIGPGLLTNSNTSAGAASAKSPRRNKPLLEF